MKRFRVCIAAMTLYLGLIAIGSPAEAGASTPSPNETIWLHRDAALNPDGWSAAGAFTDSGSWRDPFAAAGGIPSPNVFTLEIKTAQTASSGSFHMNFQGMLNVTSGAAFGGTWTIGQGSGVYSSLHGSGTWTREVDPGTGTATVVCTGVVRLG
jgi:hypothetical protein